MNQDQIKLVTRILKKLSKSSKSTFILLLILAVLLVYAFLTRSASDTTPDVSGEQTIYEGPFKVSDVVDGDTIKIDANNRKITVRYIGVDTPETVKPDTPVQCFGKEASDYNKSLVLNREVYLEKDIGDSDKYGRELRYVYLKNNGNFDMINKSLVAEGYAKVLTVPPNVKYSDEFIRLEREARENQRGLWQKCSL